MKNTIKLSMVCLIFLIGSNAFGQYALEWEQNAGQDSKKSVMSAVDSEDNIIVTGYLQSYRMYTRKYDITGSLLWEVEDASGIQSIYEKPNWINCDTNNNVLVVGHQYSIGNYEYPNAIVALKYSPTGTLLWRTVIPISTLINSTTSFDCRSVVDGNGNMYIGTAIVGGVFLYKIDTDGNLIFSNSSAINSPKNFNGMRIRNNKVVVATSSGTPNVAPVFVWDTSGTLLWTANAAGTLAADVEIDENENVYVLSSLQYMPNPITFDYDAQLTKYSPTGSLLWTYHYDFGGYNFVTRMTYVNNRISAIGYGDASGLKWFTFQTDADGTLLWSSPYNEGSPVTQSDSYPKYIIAKPNGEVIVTGVGGPTPDPFNPSYNQMPIVQYSNTGVQNWVSTPNIYAGTGLATMFASDGSLFAIGSRNMYVFHFNADALSTNENSISVKTIVAPNPFTDKVTITLDEINLPAYTIIYDVTGKELLSKNLENTSNELELSSLKSGIYFCQLTSNAKTETVKISKK
jgi:hypothetical protein